MAIEYLKRGKPEADRAEDDAKTAAIVSATLKDIEERGDSAVRELACKFDNYDRDTYRLSHNEIQAIIAKVSPEDMADIKFAQEQVRNFAQAQRDSMLDIEIETLPGAVSEELSCRLGSRRLASPDDKTQPLSLFQNITRDHPPGGDDVCPVPIVAAECGGFVARTGH